MSLASKLLEISDLIVDFDPATLRRIPVEKRQVTDRLEGNGQHQAARVVARMPTDQHGILNTEFVDALLVRVHCEMQRLSEEFQHGRRMLEMVLPMLQALSANDVKPPYRLVDVGCGTGFVIRWLAAHRSEFEHDVRLIGVDFNEVLVKEADRLARQEGLDCEFIVDNAFTLEEPATILLSTGVIHHFRGPDLADFFRQHDQSKAMAFAHYDFQPTVFARPGAWVFHKIRMREPLSHHDGVVSARRAHHARELLAASHESHFHCGMYGRWMAGILPRVMQAIVGFRDDCTASFQRALGARANRLEDMT